MRSVLHNPAFRRLFLGQSVTVHHPNYRDVLERDCRNVASFSARQGADVTAENHLSFVTGGDDEDDRATTRVVREPRPSDRRPPDPPGGVDQVIDLFTAIGCAEPFSTADPQPDA